MKDNAKITSFNIEEILKPWTADFSEAAMKEGWDVFTATDGSPVQIQRIDDPNELPEGATHLVSDAQAMMIVRTGTGPHHSAARKIIHDHFPEEWARLEEAAKNPVVVGLDFAKIETACVVSILETAKANSLGNIPLPILEKIEAQFLERARIQGYGKPSSKSYKNAEGEYFIGAMTALCTIGFIAPPRWVIAIMQNDNIAKEKK